MILRRIAEGIRQQDWFVVFVEIMIVVVGIFIGLQVDDWNQARKDRIDESAYLVRISEDIRTDMSQMSDVLSEVSIKREALIFMAKALAGEVPEASAARMLTAIQQSTNYGWQIPWVRRSTYEDLVSTGRLTLVQDARLRTVIQDYYISADGRLERIEMRLTGYAGQIYRLANADEFSIYLALLRDTDSAAAVPQASEPVTAEFITDFLKAAREADLGDLINAERNYATFLYFMVDDQLQAAEELLAVVPTD